MRIRNSSIDWPSLPQARLLIQVVFNQVSRVYHLILRKSTVEELEEVYCKASFDDSVLTCKFFALFALGEVYSARSNSCLECGVPGAAYYVNAMTVIPILPERPSLGHIESILRLVRLALNGTSSRVDRSVSILIFPQPSTPRLPPRWQCHAPRYNSRPIPRHPRMQVSEQTQWTASIEYACGGPSMSLIVCTAPRSATPSRCQRTISLWKCHPTWRAAINMNNYPTLDFWLQASSSRGLHVRSLRMRIAGRSRRILFYSGS